MSDLLVIDGAQGEGGGEILRTSLSLAAVTGRALRLTNIRAGRRNPGLAAQHVVACKAVAAVCNADLRGAQLNSREIELRPAGLTGGEFVCDVSAECPSAGSTTLILQALLPALLFSPEPSAVTLRGGTDVPWSPPYDYVAEVFAPLLRRLGASFEVSRVRPGWYPVGGGELTARVEPLAGPLQPLDLAERGPLQELVIHSLTEQRLPSHILSRQCEGARRELGAWAAQAVCHEYRLAAACPGTTCLALARFANGVGGYAELGKAGKAAEKVGAEAGEALHKLLSSAASVDHHLADQLLLYAALAAGTTTYLTTEATSHLHTNALVIAQMLGVATQITEVPHGARVTVTGLGLQPPKR
jgi:RNA 3'-terminal phosphate cyclase (ATP)